MPKERLDPAVLKLTVILVLGALAPLLDSTIVSLAIHTLGRELDASTANVQWVSTGYLLALAMVVPVSAWAAERAGGRRGWPAGPGPPPPGPVWRAGGGGGGWVGAPRAVPAPGRGRTLGAWARAGSRRGGGRGRGCTGPGTPPRRRARRRSARAG